jgi:2-polyprenyl-6-methoxyphenol hydroxylase-like FAD-dependent oxidoreductase
VKAVDFVVVGGGIAGGTFATVMARAGASVLILERQAAYRDRVRGELLWPWGVAETQRLGLEDVLVDAGANVADRFVAYDEGGEPPVRSDLSVEVTGVPGSMNLFHPTATRALAEAARAFGTQVVSAAHEVAIETSPPRVSWTDDGGRHTVACGLIIGADGRSSAVRGQAGIELHTDPTAHLATGLLVDGLDEVDPRTNLAVRASDVLFLSFPQRGGRSRLYFCMPTEQRQRFAGAEGPQRFLSTAAQLPSLPDAERWASATPAGPCATFACADTWVDRPFADGVVLIGDAGGYNNPLIGQGLSLAVRDAGVLADRLRLDGHSQAALESYAEERTERLRRARASCLIDAWANDGFNEQDPQERGRLYARAEADEVLAPLLDAQWKGFDEVKHSPSDLEVRERLFAAA